MRNIDFDEIEKKILQKSMNFSGDADNAQYLKYIYSIAVKAAINVLKEYEQTVDS
ncbi:MAG: hypothetical protein IJT16_11585 [Lachnospiraceae bacterium]|nr:hypothetical protein [Lachnospiraceae bacterium]